MNSLTFLPPSFSTPSPLASKEDYPLDSNEDAMSWDFKDVLESCRTYANKGSMGLFTGRFESSNATTNKAKRLCLMEIVGNLMEKIQMSPNGPLLRSIFFFVETFWFKLVDWVKETRGSMDLYLADNPLDSIVGKLTFILSCVSSNWPWNCTIAPRMLVLVQWPWTKLKLFTGPSGNIAMKTTNIKIRKEIATQNLSFKCEGTEKENTYCGYHSASSQIYGIGDKIGCNASHALNH